MNRRGFLGSILAAAAAPAIVRADSLMRIVPRDIVIDLAPADTGLTLFWKGDAVFTGGFTGQRSNGTVLLNGRVYKFTQERIYVTQAPSESVK